MSGQDTYTAAVLIIGNEILSGRTQDINLNYIAKSLLPRGIIVAEARVVPDVPDEIVAAVNALRAKYDYVFTTGGIGPTHDDITADCIAAAFGVGIDIRADARQVLETYYGSAELSDARLRMARIPDGAALIPNPVSGAPGFSLENVYVMAGVPRIMQAMMDHVAALLKSGKPVLMIAVACTLPESRIAAGLGAIQARYPQIDIGSYPHFSAGQIGLSLALKGTDQDDLERAAADIMDLVRSLGDEPVLLRN